MEGIKIIDDWYVTVETNPVNYIVRKGNGEKTSKGAFIDKGKSFFTTLQGAVKFVRDQIVAERLSEACTALPEAIRTISEVDKEFEKIIERIEA
jgi:hypothetical protein